MCGRFPDCRMRYEELLVKFNELQSEKTAIQEKFEFGTSSVKAMKADMKVNFNQSGCMNILTEIVTNIIFI